MKQKIIGLLMVVGCLSLGFMASDGHANIIIKVRALNPLESEEAAFISYPLPKEVSSSDIITKKITFSLSHEEEEEQKTTFNIEYVQGEERYFIIDEVMLGPREIVTLEVHVRDIWTIPQERLNRIKRTVEDLIAQASAVSDPLPDEEPEEEPVEAVPDETITALKDEIFKQFDEIVARQEKSSVLKVGVEKHMEAYYENMEALSQVEADVEMLRYLLELEEEEGEEGEEGAEEDSGIKEELPMEADLLEEEIPVMCHF